MRGTRGSQKIEDPTPRDDLVLAVSLLTCLPVFRVSTLRGDNFLRSIWAYPLVGAVIGAMGGGAYLLSETIGFGVLSGVVVSYGTMILVTGALHEDGWADFCDAVGVVGTRDRRLSVMRDPRLGTYGVLGLLLAVFGQIFFLSDIIHKASDLSNRDFFLFGVFVAVSAVSRSSICVSLIFLSAAGKGGLVGDLEKPGVLRTGLSVAIGVAISIISLGFWSGIAVCLVCFMSNGFIAVIARRKIGGYTGDVLGAGIVFATVLSYCVLAAQGVWPSVS